MRTPMRTALQAAAVAMAVAAAAGTFPTPIRAQVNTGGAMKNFATIDTDRDAKLDRLDIDHDGYLTHHELDETRNRSLLLPFPGRFKTLAAFAAADTDHDMKIDKHEYETAVVAAHMKCDRNRDGTIELDDLRHRSR